MLVVGARTGVRLPQGSVLSPLLFLLAINDLPSYTNNRTIMYADDTSFLIVDRDIGFVESSISEIMGRISCCFVACGYL